MAGRDRRRDRDGRRDHWRPAIAPGPDPHPEPPSDPRSDGGSDGTAPDADTRRRSAARARLARLAWLMDEAIPLPGGLRVGVDGLVGLLPGVGDLATLAVSLYGITLAARAGASGPLLARMVGNVALDAAVGSIPVLGDIFDVGFKANRRNARLLDAHLDRGTR